MDKQIPCPAFEIDHQSDFSFLGDPGGLEWTLSDNEVDHMYGAKLRKEEVDYMQDNISIAGSNIMDIEIRDYVELKFHNYCGVPLQDLCRLCCVPRNNVTPFYNIYTDDINIFMEQCLGLKATRCDRLPSYICKECYDNLQKFHAFYFSVRQVDVILKDKLMQSLKKFDTLPNVFEFSAAHNTQDDNKLVINIEIDKQQMSFHCPFCEYGYQSKNCMIHHMKNFHLNNRLKKEGSQNEKALKSNRRVQRQNLNNNENISPGNVTNIPVCIADPADQHIADFQAFNDLNMSDLITFNEKSLSESYDNVYYDIPDAVSYCEVPSEDKQNDDDMDMIGEYFKIPNDVAFSDAATDDVETVDPSLFTDFIIEESADGYECIKPKCNRIFKLLVWKTLHNSTEHRSYISVFKCPQCAQVYANKPQIVNHLLNAHEIGHDDSLTPTRVKCLFSCEFCGCLYTTCSGVKEHKKTCSFYISNQIKCLCGEEFPRSREYCQHFLNTHSKDILTRRPECSIFYECSICDTLFCILASSISHSRNFHRAEKREASMCGLPLHSLRLENSEILQTASKRRKAKLQNSRKKSKPMQNVTNYLLDDLEGV